MMETVCGHLLKTLLVGSCGKGKCLLTCGPQKPSHFRAGFLICKVDNNRIITVLWRLSVGFMTSKCGTQCLTYVCRCSTAPGLFIWGKRGRDTVEWVLSLSFSSLLPPFPFHALGGPLRSPQPMNSGLTPLSIPAGESASPWGPSTFVFVILSLTPSQLHWFSSESYLQIHVAFLFLEVYSILSPPSPSELSQSSARLSTCEEWFQR